ncbi:MAG: hypothetical protein UX74_C0044G0004 [Parcubacteria group bacterium GW2011_GWA2_47_10b]|nr:MAG: hypothetical protein UX74_C0044G0004 [Parcubacteria group bacterium GW2011_GWA2_47_10b]
MLANRYYKKTTRLSARIDSRRRQKRKQRIQKKIAFVFLGIVILAAGVSIFFSWEKFRISRITFSGLERTNEEALRAYIQDRLRERFVILFPRDNIFFFGPQGCIVSATPKDVCGLTKMPTRFGILQTSK